MENVTSCAAVLVYLAKAAGMPRFLLSYLLFFALQIDARQLARGWESTSYDRAIAIARYIFFFFFFFFLVNVYRHKMRDKNLVAIRV